MGYKTILVHCDATKGAASRIRVALDVARQHGAHLVGLHVRQPFQAPMFADMTAAMDALYASYEKTANADEAAAAAVFRELVGSAGASTEWRTLTGLADDCLIEAGRYADLIVLGQYDPEAPLAATSSDLVERVAMATERPTLIVPHIGVTKTPGGNVMICWNGRREAVRAVTAALPILKAAVKVISRRRAGCRDRPMARPPWREGRPAARQFRGLGYRRSHPLARRRSRHGSDRDGHLRPFAGA